MKYAVITIVCLLLTIAVVGGMFASSFIVSPEKALKEMGEQVEKSGFEALLPKLTGKAEAKISPIVNFVNTQAVQSIFIFTSIDEYAGLLIDQASAVDWSLESMDKKNSKRAIAVIEFDYANSICGTFQMELLKVDGEWMINDFSDLKVKGFNL